MIQQLKILSVILAVSWVVFRYARPVITQFMADEDFLRRRNVWWSLTATAFLSPALWVFILLAVPLLIWAFRREKSPATLYMLLMFATPLYEFEIPRIIYLSHQQILIIIALVTRPRKEPGMWVTPRGVLLMDVLLIAYATIPNVHYAVQVDFSVTALFRSVTGDLIKFVGLFHLFSRSLRSKADVEGAMAAGVLAAAIMAPLAVIESAKGWLLYTEVLNNWGNVKDPFAFLMRDGILRARLSLDHSISLGYVFALAFGFSLHLQRYMTRPVVKVGLPALMWVGMFAANSKGPWIAAILTAFAYFWLLPGGVGRVFKASAVGAIVMYAMSFTATGARLLSSLPFIGTNEEGQGSADYRMLLLDKAMEAIPLHPWFGDLFVTEREYMQALRQGQGIVDLVNGYLQVALQHGLVVLAALMIFYGRGMFCALSVARMNDGLRGEGQVSATASNLAACMVGAAFLAWTGGFPRQWIILCGMAAVLYWSVRVPQHRGNLLRPKQ